MPSVARALQGTDNGMLWEILEVIEGERQLLVYKPGNCDAMGLRVKIGDRAMIAVIGDIIGSDEPGLTMIRDHVGGKITQWS